jgi:hypothetical protein
MSNLSLYQLANEHRAMVELLMDTHEDSRIIADTVEGESYPLEQKARNMAYAIKNLEATAEAIKQAEAEMAARRKAIENRASRLREYTMTCMEIAGVKKIDCPHFALTIKSNPEAVEVYEEALIPAKFFKVPQPVLDKTALRAAIKAGEVPTGATLVKTTRLEIK